MAARWWAVAAWIASSGTASTSSAARRARPSVAPSYRTGGRASSSATSRRSRRSPDGGVRVDEEVDDPGRADRPRPGRHRRWRPWPGSSDLTWFGTRAARDLPRPEARRAASVAGTTTVDEHVVPYVRPQENGGHADVALAGARATAHGRGLRIDARRAAPGVGDPLPRRGPGDGDPRRRARRRGRRRSSTSTRPIAALGTASCGPDTLPGYLVGPGTYRWSWTLRADRAGRERDRSTGDPADREFHLRNERISYLIGIAENGALGHLYLGPAARGRPVVRATSAGGRSAGFANRLGESESRSSTRRHGLGDYRVPALTVEQPDGSTVLDLALREPPDPAGQAADRRPAVDLRRGRRRGRDRSRSPSSTRRAAPRCALSYTIFRDAPAIARSVRVRQHGPGPVAPADRHERRARPARRRLGARPPERHLGPRAARRATGRSPRAGSRSAASAARPATSTTRSSLLRRADARPRPPARRSA